MKSWKGVSCRKTVRALEIELAGALEGRAVDRDGKNLPSGMLARSRTQIEKDLALWRSRLAGPELPADPVVSCPACQQCGVKLRPTFDRVSVRVDTSEGFHTREQAGALLGFGYLARGHFCSLRCGWAFAINTVEGKCTA